MDKVAIEKLVETIHTRLDNINGQLTELMAADRRRTDELTSQLKQLQQQSGALRGMAAQLTNASRAAALTLVVDESDGAS